MGGQLRQRAGVVRPAELAVVFGFLGCFGSIPGSWAQALVCCFVCLCARGPVLGPLHINHVLTGLTHPRTARTLVALTWHPLELAQSVWPQRPAGSR